MKIVAKYSFNDGEAAVKKKYTKPLQEVYSVVAQVDSATHKTKSSKEKTMPGRVLYSPVSLNRAFKAAFESAGWNKRKVPCDYSTEFYVKSYTPRSFNKGAFREMDFLKGKLGVEVQFGKYAFMVYNVCAKMTIFHNLGFIDMGIEIVPVKAFADEMSTGVSYFEQFVWDLEHRGVSNIDIPVLVLGIDR